MRKIKYRVWIPDIKRIYQVMSFDVEPQNGRRKTVTVWEHPCVETAIIKMKIGKFLLDNGVELIEYTGLKDRNGKEIYEGDIVTKLNLNHINADGAYDKPECMKYIDRGVVEYMEDNCQFMLARRRNPGRLTDSCNNSISICSSRESLEFEIIGNIYENPELLI